MDALTEAIKLAGSQAALARALKINKSNITRWVKRQHVPAVHAINMCRMYGFEVTAFPSRRKGEK